MLQRGERATEKRKLIGRHRIDLGATIVAGSPIGLDNVQEQFGSPLPVIVGESALEKVIKKYVCDLKPFEAQRQKDMAE